MSTAHTPLLLPEALGFSPQLLLDDIINAVNNTIVEGVNAMEDFLRQWADRRSEEEKDWDSTEELEQGLVSFETLLEHHTDVALDFFEAWALKNIFSIPPDLPVVLPHQKGLDLTTKPEREAELMEEISELRIKLDNQRRLQRLYNRALRTSRQQRSRSERRLERLAAVLDHEKLISLAKIPPQLNAMYEAVSRLPPLDPALVATLPPIEPGKRDWETSKAGYLNWATAQLLSRAKVDEDVHGSSAVDDMFRNMAQIGQADQIRKAVEITESVRTGLQDVDVTMESEES
ncbi:Mis12 protein-domain-containing protein [Lentinula edodes]|uniref:Mis12 protein-domain-containing protein n=1 Tax=Lentinula edodes TaxID=5353 RepID=UPI001E8E6D1D|nr:Mis12 protein-domain-containing protein [Lentinula edodes]KAH7880349.1 Mis12 protein-domain-containing protein [Lentinula edodes]KAJ3900817.1 Mis12 protein-domain-containing protein [Lentinula edodes]